MSRTFFVVPLVIALASGLAHASQVAYQGRLEDAGTGPLDGYYDFQFTIWTAATAGSDLWTEDQVNVRVNGGAFSVLLGSVVDIPISVWATNPVYLSIAVRPNGDTTWTLLQNRQLIAYVPRAVQAQSLAACAVRTNSATATNNANFAVQAPCQGSESVMAGGYSLPGVVTNFFVTSSYPDVGNERWAVAGRNNSGANQTVTVYAVCCP